MNFGELLEQGQSKKTTTLIVNEVCKHPKKMDELMRLFNSNKSYVLLQRVAYPFSYIIENRPALIIDYYPFLIQRLNEKENHSAVTRNILRAFQFVEIPEEHQGIILDSCFKLLNSSDEPIAVKAFSMTVIFNLSKKYPDIIPELKVSIETLMPNASSGVKNRGKKILKAIQ